MIFKKKKFNNIFLTALLILIAFSSLLNIYDKREKIYKKIIKSEVKESAKKYQINEHNHKIAKKILKGGFILYFRHAEREKWLDVGMYDSYELGNKIKRAEETEFKKAVCLSDKGINQVKIMSEYVKLFDIPVSKVITSPSCRARQTAEYVFEGFDEVNNLFLHYGIYYENKSAYSKLIKKELLKIEEKEDSNIIITAHGGVIEKSIFDEILNNEKKFDLNEGGFFVIKKNKGKLILVHKFHNFDNFKRLLVKRPTN